jgi:toxin ParE1/3/4
MPVDLIWHPQARLDLLDIYEIIGLDNPMAAERFYDLVEASSTRAASLGYPANGPHAGRRCVSHSF